MELDDWLTIGDDSWKDGNFVKGVKYNPASGLWDASLSVNESIFPIGSFQTKLAAAVAHDMEALRAYGLNAHEHVIFSYQLRTGEQCNHGKMKKIFDARCLRTNMSFVVDIAPSDSAEGYVPVTCKKPVLQSDRFVSSMVFSHGIPPPKIDISRRWMDRVSSSFALSAAFTYEVTFPTQQSLGINLKVHGISYSAGSGGRILGCCIVVETINTKIASIILPGDILLKVNGASLLGSPKEGFDFDKVTQLISTAPSPRTIKILRPAGISPNFCISPAEIFLLHAEDKCTARFTVPDTATVGAGNTGVTTSAAADAVTVVISDQQARTPTYSTKFSSELQSTF